jgi:hypothetical protein
MQLLRYVDGDYAESGTFKALRKVLGPASPGDDRSGRAGGCAQALQARRSLVLANVVVAIENMREAPYATAMQRQ